MSGACPAIRYPETFAVTNAAFSAVTDAAVLYT